MLGIDCLEFSLLGLVKYVGFTLEITLPYTKTRFDHMSVWEALPSQ